MQAPLNQLSLDRWYKVLVAACFVTFLLAGAGVLQLLPAIPTLLISLGGFWVGLGEWVNHSTITEFFPESFYRPAGRVVRTVRKPRGLGVAFDALGAALAAGGVAHGLIGAAGS